MFLVPDKIIGKTSHMNNNNERTNAPILLTAMLSILATSKPVFGQERIFNRILALAMAELFAFGRRTITQLLLTLGLVDEDWTAWYRLFSQQRFVEEEASQVILREVVAEQPMHSPFVVGSDAFHVPRSSAKMPGSGWMKGLNTASFKPGIQRGQRFVETSWLTPLANGYSRAVPLRCLSAFTEKAVASESDPPRKEVAAALESLQWVRNELDASGRQQQLLFSLNDGNYDTLAFWPGLPTNTVAAVRTARNRCLYKLPDADAHGNCKYGDKAPAPHQWLKKRKGFRRTQVQVRGRERPMRYRVEGPFVRDGLPNIPLFLIVIGGGKRPRGSRRKRYQPCFFLVSALCVDGQWELPFPITTILTWLWQRWELEIAHRQLKTGLGLGEKQCWNDCATVASVQWTVWIYSLMLLAGIRAWGDRPLEKPPGQWRTMPNRWSFNTLCRAFRAEMWAAADFRTTWTWSRDNWVENEVLSHSLFNSVLASVRL